MELSGPKRQTLKISLLFFILFTATNSFLTILTYIYEQASLTAIGPANIAISYMAFILSTVYAPSCSWTIKNQMLIATFAYTINFSTGLFVPLVSLPFKFILTCSGAAICGLSAGLLWVSQGRYIHIICERAGVKQQKGQHFGLFSVIYCLSHISAGAITTFGLGLFSVQIYFLTITATGICSIIFCFFFIKNVTQDSFPEQPLTNNNQRIQPVDVSQSSLGGVFRYYPKMFSILFILIIDGICFGIHISEITHMIPSDTPIEYLNLYAGYCNVALGCGASLGGYISGKLGDLLGGKKSGSLGISFFVVGCILAMATLQAQNFTLTLISAFYWGFFLFYIEGWLYIVCSRQFKGRSQSFSVNKQLGSITCFLFQLIVMFTGNQLNLQIVFAAISVLAIPAFISLRKLPCEQNQAIQDPQTTNSTLDNTLLFH